MKTVSTSVQAKLEEGRENIERVIVTCVEHLQLPSAHNLQKIGARLGNVVNNLCSPLNYSIRELIEAELRGKLPPRDYKRLKGDFPYSRTSKADFDHLPLVQHTAIHRPDIYQLLESVQPYHTDYKWLGYLMGLSNQDKHELTIEVADINPNDFALLNKFNASIFGNRVMMSYEGSEPTIASTPCFVRPYQAFATENRGWVLFLVNFEDERIGLVKFMELANAGIQKIVSDFYQLL
ncbi:MAG TPA: hypothetical protein VI793_03695 [Anaerolineales bacterium]|nr:hypothetical protein [Anaerolineales bacterium]